MCTLTLERKLAKRAIWTAAGDYSIDAAMDLMCRAWSRGEECSREEHQNLDTST